MGLSFALAKTLAALFIGLAAGFATHALTRRSVFANPLKGFGARGGPGGVPTEVRLRSRPGFSGVGESLRSSLVSY